MAVSIADFWKLLGESRLLAPEHVQQLSADFSQVKGAADQGSAKTAAEWLVSRNVLSKYQTTILLAGRSGPFFYGEYKIYDRIEKGRLAGQFRALHGPTGHPVLLEFMTGPMLTDPHLWSIAAGSTLAAAAINSPHVQRYFEPADLGQFKFAVGEDLRGTSLDSRLAIGRFPPAEACRIIRMAAIGLAQMHQLGRVHGDIRPANILLEPVPSHPGNVKLLYEAYSPPRPIDFSQQDAGGGIAAMADFHAPELFNTGRHPDMMSDIYSLGCTLYAMLAGSPPFSGGSVSERMSRHANENPRPLEQYGVPQPLAQLVAYMMARNPAARYQSAAMIAEQLTPFVDSSLLAPPPVAVLPTLQNYEAFLRQKYAAAPPPPPMAPAMSPPTPAPFVLSRPGPPEPIFGAPPGGFGPAPMAFPPPAAAGFPPPSNAPIDLSPPTPVVRTGPSTAKGAASYVAQQRARRNQQQLFMVIGSALALLVLVAVSVVVVMNNMGEPDLPDETGLIAQNDGGEEDVPEEGTEGDGSKTGTEKDGGGKTTVTNTGSKTGSDPGTTTGSTGNTSASGSGVAANDGSFKQEVLPDDGSLLWASPTTGKPVAFHCVPPGGQVFIIARPSDMIASGEGDRVLQALGPKFGAVREQFEMASGFKLAEIEQLIVTLHPAGGQIPRTSVVVKTKEPVPTDQLLAKWGNPTAALEGDKTYYTAASWAYYISASPEAERTFAMGEAAEIQAVASSAGAPPLVFRELERLRRVTDDQRHFTILAAPSFLLGDDGAALFAGERSKVREPLAWLLGDGLQAALISSHFGADLYLESRMIGSLDKEPLALASDARDRLGQVPGKLESYMDQVFVPQYFSRLARRYPLMVGQVQSNLRSGVENDQAVVNTVLPGSAAHNLVLGGELLIAAGPGGPAIAVTPTPAATGPKTIEEALQLKTSYSFDNQSLEFAMRDLAVEVRDLAKGAPFEFDIKIVGDDLKLDGITRNQSVRDFKQENKSVAEILTALVMKANPVTTVKDPSETDQKLVWLIGPDPEKPDRNIVLITTRTAATTKKFTLPPPFVPKNT